MKKIFQKKKVDTFDPSFFRQLKNAEATHFWFQVRKKWILDKIEKFALPPASVLEVGCGSGYVSSFLARHGYDVTGCEYYKDALEMAWPNFKQMQGSAEQLPFDDASFDVVGLFDVIEHFEDDTLPLNESVRVLKKDGIIVMTVPARVELWSFIDERSLHKRRYTKSTLCNILAGAGLETVLIEYMFMSLYYPMKYSRRRQAKSNNQFEISRLSNALFRGVFNFERIMSKYISLPIGTSLIAIARKIS